ncbi:MAG TPA: c-type cytochrome [Rhizomicrobium sp.]|nr:c-type cytochrome [Rhizomicrobium sp.]
MMAIRSFAGCPGKEKLYLAGMLFWAAAITPALAQPASPALPELSKCQGCHGQNGDSSSADVPRLNGQQAQYLANRVRSFGDLTRQTAHATYAMSDVNSQLSDAAVVALAKYFSAQPPTAPAPKGMLAEQGRQLYEHGDGSNVPACQTCHGAGADGKGAVPRLAGQHGAYLRRQMESFSLMTRVNDTMNFHSRALSHDQILALTAYLAKD